jgi:hypothetical protein
MSSLNPKISFLPSGSYVSLTGEASRTDLHKVTMGLAIAGPGVGLVKPVRAGLFAPPLLTAKTRTDTEAAADAVNQFLTLKLFRPNIITS